MSYPTLVDRITELVKFQLPSFIREDHQNFIVFMEAYYEWMETIYKKEINPYYGSSKIVDYSDIDKTLTEFIRYFSSEFLVHIPQQILCDRKKLLKNIKEFYRSRGSEKSYELLFRIMFLDKIDFYYPTVDILRPDEGKWVLRKSIRCIRPKTTQLFDLNVEFIGKKIFGYKSRASGVVDYIIEYDAGYSKIHEIFFKKNTIYGNFIPWETVSTSDESFNKLQIQPILVRIDIDYGGGAYSYNSPITIINPYGVNMGAVIREVDPNGKILDIQIIDPGFGYPVYPVDNTNQPSIIFENRDIETAISTPVMGALFEYPGYYVNTDGFLDSVEKLRDDYLYQEFSYVLRTHTNLIDWYDIVHKILHPAGTLAFNNLIIEPDLIFIGPHIDKNRGVSLKIHTPTQVINSEMTLPENSFLLHKTIQDGSNQESTKIGSLYKSIVRDSFRNLPTQMYNSNALSLPPNYLVDYANYSLEDLCDFELDKLLKGTEKTVVQPRVTVSVGFSIKGTIFNGLIPLENIDVTLVGTDKNLTTKTNSFGEFFFVGLNHDRYRIDLEDNGSDLLLENSGDFILESGTIVPSVGTYEITPSHPAWVFDPPTLIVVLTYGNEHDADFQASS